MPDLIQICSLRQLPCHDGCRISWHQVEHAEYEERYTKQKYNSDQYLFYNIIPHEKNRSSFQIDMALNSSFSLQKPSSACTDNFAIFMPKLHTAITFCTKNKALLSKSPYFFDKKRNINFLSSPFLHLYQPF